MKENCRVDSSLSFRKFLTKYKLLLVAVRLLNKRDPIKLRLIEQHLKSLNIKLRLATTSFSSKTERKFQREFLYLESVRFLTLVCNPESYKDVLENSMSPIWMVKSKKCIRSWMLRKILKWRMANSIHTLFFLQQLERRRFSSVILRNLKSFWFRS